MPSGSRYPKRLRDQELQVQAFRDMKTTRDELNDFKVVLTFPDRVVTPFGNAISRETSTSWRGRTREAAIYRGNVQDYLQRLTKGIQLVDKSDLTLSGRSATIPVTVQNKLVQGVDHLVLRLVSNNGNRLKINGERAAELPVKVGAGHSQSVKFDATAAVNGQVPVTAQLYTEDGTPYGKPMSFTVKVSEITPTVMLVIAGGVLLLVLAGVRMYTQRKRLAAQAAEAEAAESAEGAAETAEKAEEPEEAGPAEPGPEPGKNDTAGPEQPSDPTPDTGSESGDPSATGEKVDR